MANKPPYAQGNDSSLVELGDFPTMDTGSPRPRVVATEWALSLSFYNLEHSGDEFVSGEPITIVNFVRPACHYLGAPNDEALCGHPLYKHGLKSYSVFEVHNSAWIRALEVMNSVHPKHDTERFRKHKRHFIFTFHDSIFECVASGYEFGVTRVEV